MLLLVLCQLDLSVSIKSIDYATVCCFLDFVKRIFSVSTEISWQQ